MERSGKDGALSEYSAVQEVERAYNMPVLSIANLDDLMAYLEQDGGNAALSQYRGAVEAYRARYGAV